MDPAVVRSGPEHPLKAPTTRRPQNIRQRLAAVGFARLRNAARFATIAASCCQTRWLVVCWNSRASFKSGLAALALL